MSVVGAAVLSTALLDQTTLTPGTEVREVQFGPYWTTGPCVLSFVFQRTFLEWSLLH